MKGITKLTATAFAVLTLSGCDWFDGDDNTTETVTPPPPPSSTFVRVHHTSPDAPDVNVLVNGEAALEAVPYQTSSGVLELDAGDYEIQVDGILPGGDVATVIGPADLSFAADTRYEIFAVGKVGDESIAPLILENAVAPVTDGNVRVQVVHAAPDAPDVDVYVTAPDADLADETAVGTLSFGDNTAQLEVPTGDYQIRVTVAGDPTAVAFDSGTVNLDAGADLVVAAVANTAAGESPVALQVSDGTTTELVYDVNSGSNLRVVHASADAPNVDITLNNAAEPAIADLAFGSFAGYVNLAADDYLVDVAAAGGDPVVIDDAELSLELGAQYSVYAIGGLADLTLAVLPETNRSIATAAQLQVVHASVSAGNVDIYLTATDDIIDAEPTVGDVPFTIDDLVSTGNLQVPAGDYVVTVTAAGTKDAAIGPVPVTLAAGGVYTAVAVDADGGGLPPQLILMDDFVE